MANQARRQAGNLPYMGDVFDAATRIDGHATRTPVLTSSALDDMFGTRLFFKCENFQKAGAFKFRGACNTVFLTVAGPKRVVVWRRILRATTGRRWRWRRACAAFPAGVVMPRNAPRVKKAAVAGYGAEIDYCAPTLAAREASLAAIVARTERCSRSSRMTTRALSRAREPPRWNSSTLCRTLTWSWCPSAAVDSRRALLWRSSRVLRRLAWSPSNHRGADDAYRSFRAGERLPSVAPQTIADGLLTSVGVRNFALIQRFVDDIVTVGDPAIVRAMRLIWERMKIVVEPSAAVPLAALVENRIDVRGMRIGMVLSGGNVDLDRLPW